jgi:hypothetical protein
VSKSLFTMQFQQRCDADDAAPRPNEVASDTSWLPLTAARMEDCVAVRELDVTLGPVPVRNCKTLRPVDFAAALACWLAGALAAGFLEGLLAALGNVGFRIWLIPWMTICGRQSKGGWPSIQHGIATRWVVCIVVVDLQQAQPQHSCTVHT